MTEAIHYQGIDELHRDLADVQAQRRTARVAAGLAATATVVCGSLIVAVLAVGYWPDQPPTTLRWMLLVAIAVGWFVAIRALVVRPALWRQTPAQVARYVEAHDRHLRNGLINAVLLADDTGQPSPQLVQRAIQETTQRARRLDWSDTVSFRRSRRWACAALAAVVAFGALVTFQPGPTRRALLAVAMPLRYVARDNTIKLTRLSPRDTALFAGQPLEIIATIDNPQGVPHVAEVVIDGGQVHTMLPTDSNTVYAASLGPVQKTLRYAVQIDDSRWPVDRRWYTVTVIERIKVNSMAVRLTYPAYTKLQPRVDDDFAGPIKAPAGSSAVLTVVFSAPAPGAQIQQRQADVIPMIRSDDGRTFTATIPVDADGAYRIVVRDERGEVLRHFPNQPNGDEERGEFWPITAIADRPPTVRFIAPGGDVSVGQGGRLAMQLSVADDYGLWAATIYAATDGKSFRPIHQVDPSKLVGGRLDYVHRFDDRLQAGDIVTYYAEVADGRDLPGVGGPQTARTATFTATIRDAAELADQRAKRYAELRRRLTALLKLQAAQRVNTGLCLSVHTTVGQVVETANAIAAAQKAVRAELADLASNFPFDQHTQAVHFVLAELAGNEAATAIAQAGALSGLAELARRERLAPALARTQEAIIARLETLLAVLAALKTTDTERDPAAGGDLSADAREELTRLKAALDEFIEAQRKIVEATTALAKTPADDLTADDRKLLGELAAAQDKWEAFLDEVFTDLSELARQDFASPLLLKELLSIKTDITMAKDALSAEAVEMAVSLEEAGIENAQALTTNLEKWLPDTPDRQKWSMEDPVDSDSIEQTELPTELQDMVGDLLEEEEDLFDEIEDITSKWTDSLDEGAGWEAADGPISNMSAQGVTGNVLPNSSEISGRSGEGRTGKSSGEFVQDEAVGKGGRRTPTRLTGEPYQAGQVRDSSAEPPGGATGGGKLSGAGSEGLEGPVPPPLAKELERMAAQQAVLVNRAERLAGKFAAGDLAGMRMLETVTLMNRVRNDLARYRYRNALRIRAKTITSLRDAAAALGGRVDVVADVTDALPAHLRDAIHDAAEAPLPAEFRRELEAYYRRLSRRADGK
ncbi:hypothetical protein LCGC14_0644660 [marine sediment metagenome]|uniref:DUF4175 domain-containing protein n=1 Tax=marine sediment metagenome TaxID=412755 RepID=A0A0F9R3E4_9ZZZZ|nr:hypothetical protein [Phycisphaerae bacterium]